MNEPISLDTNTQPTAPSISLDARLSAPALPAAEVDKRARKAEFGLGPQTGLDKDKAFQAISSGNEPSLRRSSAAYLDEQNANKRSELISKMGQMTPDQLQFINDKFTLSKFLGQAPPTDPGSVFEEYYAGEYMKPMWNISDQFNKGSFMPDAVKEIPDHVEKLRVAGEGIIKTNEIIRNRLEETKARYDNQSYVGAAVDWAKGMVPGYTEYKSRGNTEQTSFFSGLRGTNLMAQAREDWLLPPDELKKKFSATMDRLEKDNPQQAIEYGEAMLGFSTSDEHLRNFGTLADASMIPIAGIAKGILKGGSAAIRGAANATGLTEALAKQAEKAVVDVVKSTEGEGVPLRVLANQHFGEQSSRIDFELKAWRDHYKNVAKSEDLYPNEGLKSQALTKVFNTINNLEEQKKDLQTWHAEKMIETSGKDGGQDIIVRQTVDKDPVVAAAQGRGDLKTAAIEKTANTVMDDMKGIGNPEKNSVEALTQSMRTDQKEFSANPGVGGNEIANRMEEDTNSLIKNIQNGIKNIARVQRVPFLAAKKPVLDALKALAEYTKDLYPGIKNAILDVSAPYQNLTKTGWNQKMFFGRMTGELFQTKEEAEGFAQLNGLNGIAVADQKGLGWTLHVEKPVDETSHPIRDWLIKTKEQETPGGWLNAMVGWLRTPEDTLSFEQNMQRKLATYNAGPFILYAKEAIKDIRSLAGVKNVKNWYSELKDLERVLDASRSKPDPVDPSLKGYFFKTGQELDDEYQRLFQRFPSVREKSAYFQFKRITEYDRVLRMMAIYRNKIRVGGESHTISIMGEDGTKVSSDPFDARVVDTFPGGIDNIFIADRDGNKIYKANGMPDKLRQDLIEKQKLGEVKVLEVLQPKLKPLNGFGKAGDARIRYVVTRNSTSEPLDITKQLPRRGGGHFDYDYSHYIVQPDIQYDEASKTHWFEGHRTIMPTTLRSMGEDIVGRLNKVRYLIQQDKIDEARTFATSKEGIPAIPWEDHLGWYNTSKDAKGRTLPPRLNKDVPIRVVPKDTSVLNVDNSLRVQYPDLQDGTRETPLLGQVQYTGERDEQEMMALRDIGTRHNPLYKYEPAKLVDPITTMNRAMARIVSSTFMDDYKIYSVESWIQDAKHWLDFGNRSPDDILRSPFYYFNNPTWRKDALKDAPDAIKNLMANKLKIDQLVGVPSKTDTFLHSAGQALADSVYQGFGPKAAELAPAWLLPKLRDPFRFFRTVVFNEKMGLFSVPQFFVHAMTIANVYGIAGPKNAMKGTFAAYAHMLASVNSNPEILDTLSRMAEKMGWGVGEWRESYETLMGRTGFMDVGNEHVLMDAPLANKIIQNAGGNFLDAGQIFFRGGVKSLRAASWHTAFKEFRDLNPVGRITDEDLKRILYRADLLSHNMSRASTSSLTTGVLSTPAQFYTYQLRLAEMMAPFIGKRLSTLEKARLFGVNAALFGAPVATGLYGYPFADNLKEYARQNGYVVGDNALSTGIMEGGLSLLGGYISGQGELHKGNIYNVGERYGAKGTDIDAILDGDKTLWQVYGGAAFNSLSNTWAQTSGLRALGMGLIRGDLPVNATPEDFIGPFKEITSVNAVNHIIAATRYGNWLSKNNANIHPTTVQASIFSAITGLTEQRDTDMWTMAQSLKANKEYDNRLFSMFQNRFSLGIQAHMNNDLEQGKAYMREAMSILHKGGYPEEKIPEAIAVAMENAHTNAIDRTKFNYYLKDMPNKQPEAYQASMNIDRARGEKP